MDQGENSQIDPPNYINQQKIKGSCRGRKARGQTIHYFRQIGRKLIKSTTSPLTDKSVLHGQ